MARETLHTFADLDNPDVKRGLMSIVGRLSGWWEVTIQPRRNTRSLQQLRYLWAVVNEALFHYLRDCGWELQHVGQAHAWAKSEFLKMPIVKSTGEVVGELTGSTGDLDTVGMGEYIDRVRKFLEENGVMTPDPDPCWQQQKAGAA